MPLQDSIRLFQRLGVDPALLSPRDFNNAYVRLAKRYHPDSSDQPSPQLMAHINAARAAILQSYRPSPRPLTQPAVATGSAG